MLCSYQTSHTPLNATVEYHICISCLMSVSSSTKLWGWNNWVLLGSTTGLFSLLLKRKSNLKKGRARVDLLCYFHGGLFLYSYVKQWAWRRDEHSSIVEIGSSWFNRWFCNKLPETALLMYNKYNNSFIDV